MNWSTLSDTHPLIVDVLQSWEVLLQGRHQERVYHEFLRAHANLFLVDGVSSFFAISKLKLGSDLETDFAVPYEEGSLGFHWELIEIKTPQAAPFTEAGTPSGTLVKATQQIRDWQAWLRRSRSEALRSFALSSIRPSDQPNFRYTIILGTRENTAKFLEKRNQYAEENGIRVRTFDYLTDRLRRRVYFDKAYVGDGCWDSENPHLCAELANPFVEALSDSRWKMLLKEPTATNPHFVSRACASLLRVWIPNGSLIGRFRREYASSTPGDGVEAS